MATTWMKALHRSGGSIAAALNRTTDYVENPNKTNGGELIDAYECKPYTAQSEFLFSKRLYEQKTGRDQGRHDVIAYHIRMSFKPGEVTAAQALELGRELALRWTKGRHQFIVAAHTNTNNPHAHIIFNSVNLDCTHKQEYATLAAEKKKLYQGYRPAREEMIALLRAKSNVDRILGEPRQPSKTHEHDAR